MKTKPYDIRWHGRGGQGTVTAAKIVAQAAYFKGYQGVMEAHGIPYVATANAAYPLDLYEKVRKAKEIKGTRFIHIFSPCSPGWRFPVNDTIEIGKLAVETGWCILYEVENGNFRLTSASESIALGRVAI